MIKIRLPFPPKELSPNRRLHYMQRYKEKKRYKNLCHLSAVMQVRSDPAQLAELIDIKHAVLSKKRLNLQLDYTLPNRRKYDHDNLNSRMKSGIDAIAELLKIDDYNFKISGDIDRVNIDSKKLGYVDCYISTCD